MNSPEFHSNLDLVVWIANGSQHTSSFIAYTGLISIQYLWPSCCRGLDSSCTSLSKEKLCDAYYHLPQWAQYLGNTWTMACTSYQSHHILNM